MARPLMIDGKLPMRIFVDNGYRYAVTRTSFRKPDGKYNHELHYLQDILCKQKAAEPLPDKAAYA